MKRLLVSLALLLHSGAVEALAAGGKSLNPVAKALRSTARPVIVHLWDPDPSKLSDFAIDEVSLAARDAGAVAVLCAPSLVSAVAKEQEAARGQYPGPLPVVADCYLRDLAETPDEICGGAKSLGASGIGIRYHEGDFEEGEELEGKLRSAVSAVEERGLGAILLGEFGADGAEGTAGAGALAERVGAAAGLSRDGEDGSALALGCWTGESDQLQDLRAKGVAGLVLKDACNGNVAAGSRIKFPSLAAQGVSKLVKAALSKGSTSVWAGAGSTSGGVGGGGSIADYYSRSGDPRDR